LVSSGGPSGLVAGFGGGVATRGSSATTGLAGVDTGRDAGAFAAAGARTGRDVFAGAGPVEADTAAGDSDLFDSRRVDSGRVDSGRCAAGVTAAEGLGAAAGELGATAGELGTTAGELGVGRLRTSSSVMSSAFSELASRPAEHRHAKSAAAVMPAPTTMTRYHDLGDLADTLNSSRSTRIDLGVMTPFHTGEYAGACLIRGSRHHMRADSMNGTSRPLRDAKCR
jgi:hypothetical protein